MPVVLFIRDILMLTGLMVMLYGWMLLGHAAGL